MKQTSANDWVHLTCALFSDQFEIENYETMEITSRIKSDKRVPKTGKKCEHCLMHGNLFKCGHHDCDRYTHIYCAFKNKIQYVIEEEETIEGWKFKLQVYPGSGQGPKVNFDENEPRLHQGVNTIFKKCIEFMMGDRPIIENEVSSNNILLSGSKSQNKRKAKQPKKKSNLKEKEIKDTIDQNEDKLGQIHKKLSETISNYFNSSGNSQIISLKDQIYRGGKMILECSEHRSPDLFCVCNRSYDDYITNSTWVGCDRCDSWFHNICIDLKVENVDKIIFFCEKCKNWARHRQLNLSKDQVNFSFYRIIFINDIFLEEY